MEQQPINPGPSNQESQRKSAGEPSRHTNGLGDDSLQRLMKMISYLTDFL